VIVTLLKFGLLNQLRRPACSASSPVHEAFDTECQDQWHW